MPKTNGLCIKMPCADGAGSLLMSPLILIAHLFLGMLQQTFRAQAPALSVPQAWLLGQVVLPQPVFDAQAALRLLERIQQANYAAYRSHRQRTLSKLGRT